MAEQVTNSPAETERVGMLLGERLQPGDVILLTGELGAGKTTFVRGVAQGTGSRAEVASPTFQLVRVYPGRVQLAHVDLYRVESSSELRDLGLEELAENGAVVVEWGDRLLSSPLGGEVAPKATEGLDQYALIELKHMGGDRRLIRTKRDLRH